ncbi:insulin-like growth factor-binding protein 6 isoform X1 [Bos indicus]|uniref:Insulin like growth factor binding protein 6 n=3 Tax=Bovinae TaxID=27592 RepID=F1MUK3_BOVIN|nr:insulin-like growth factor-binding protein 6 isoform X1 [Bos taurus]XP_010856198.1 PREDICTED: insulin-like growth factor-binding protein 6 isoform X1 [Bison bison bison]XP_019816055.1 PREDICTED: insulin-like growth factor-binding protein 6 isoform X1 [Bos indicus]XP_027398779.1 insulin-like growth factor-binding protein 6 isoform X1 [Bos indicus x Bos taurus]
MTPHRLLPPLLLTLLLAARPGGALARCPGCGQGVSAGCPGGCAEEEDGGPAAEGCAEAGGCLRREGQQCGVYTPNCAPGLQCQPPEKEDLPLRALLQGRGRCGRARTPSGENPKESKPQAGTARSQDVNRRDQQRNSGTSTTPSRSNSGGVQDTEMSPIPVLGAWLVGPAGSAAELSLPPRVPAANIWTPCCSNSRPRSSAGLTPSTCLIVTIGASTGSGSAAPPRGSAEVLAGVWIAWASPCPGLQKAAMEAPSAPPAAAAKPGLGAAGPLAGAWGRPLGYLLSDG